MTSWRDLDPDDAFDIDCRERPDLNPPHNEEGEVCMWPWEPQQLVGVSMGMYHCNYCGAMCVAGLPHPDYGRPRIIPEGRPGAWMWQSSPGRGQLVKRRDVWLRSHVNVELPTEDAGEEEPP